MKPRAVVAEMADSSDSVPRSEAEVITIDDSDEDTNNKVSASTSDDEGFHEHPLISYAQFLNACSYDCRMCGAFKSKDIQASTTRYTQAFFFDIWRKTQVEQKLRFLTKLRYFSRNSGPENAKRYLNRKNCNGSTFFMYLGFENFQKLRSIFVKLRSVFEKLRSEIAKNIPQP